MSLLLTIFVLAGATAFWYWYDPTILKQIDLAIVSIPHPDVNENHDDGRIRSGEHLYFTIQLKNRSDKRLVDPSLHFNLPPGFSIINSNVSFSSSTHSIELPPLKPHSEKTINFEGTMVGEPNQDYIFGIELLYRQDYKKQYEVKTNSFIITPRGSVLKADITNPDAIFPSSQWSSDLTIKNIYHHAISSIVIPLKINGRAVTIFPGKPTLGYIDKNNWKLPALLPNESATLPLKFVAKLPDSTIEAPVFITPQLEANTTWFNQTSAGSMVKILHPGISSKGAWVGDDKVSPGETATINVSFTNTGDVDLRDVVVSPAFPASIVSAKQFASLNQPIKIKKWPRGATQSFIIKIPINRSVTGNKNIQFSPRLALSARADGLSETFTTNLDLPEIKIGSHLILNTEARYYSPEGDQLGRGALPPKVGKETKYWTMLHITNTTSDVVKLVLKATLAPGVQWTGKTSVSRGAEPKYNPSSRTITWEISSLSAFDSANINFEVGITPTESQQGTTPMLLTNIHASAFDTYIEKDISVIGSSVDSSLPKDIRARQKGVVVE